MRVYIYDLEVFAYDWIAVFRNPEAEDNHIVVHNDNYQLREFLGQPDVILGGFNNKHYDNWILLTMINGGDNERVKDHNDFIIGGANGWEYPFIRGQPKPFKSFDLRDDIDKSLSLKAIEGNLNLPIVESSVPFDIARPLTKLELAEVIRYCKNDVDATVRLYQERVEYITSKKIVGDMYGVPPEDALGLTNAKLSARALGARPVERDDERDYRIPDNLDPDLIPEPVLSFFMQIRDKSIPYVKLFGAGKGSKGMTLDVILKTSGGECPVTYAWGGVHGAKLAYKAEETDDRLIVNYDVASLYPNSMINFGYCSRSMEDPDAYEELVKTRLRYKGIAGQMSKKIAKKYGDEWYKRTDEIRRECDEETRKDIETYLDANAKQAALKLVINTVYGAMLNRYNDLADRRAGRSVCISNQLAMTQLIVMLSRRCESIDFININTDGIMFFIDKAEDALAAQIVEEWSRVTGFEMERDDFKRIVQKDVNNYIGILTSGKMKTKGGYVKLYKGGDFTSNSLVIIHKAIVDYLVKDIPVETTIGKATSINDFQMIAKTGGTYKRSVHMVDGRPVPVQNVNRIYATKNTRYGQIKKIKYIREKTIRGKVVKYDPPLVQEDTLSECPEHAIVDNTNVLTLADIDKDFYIELAKKRINDYTVPKRVRKKEKEVISIMATKVTETQTEAIDWSEKNVFAKLIEARRRFLEAPIKKTGVNRYAEFKYFTLEDIVPAKTQIFNDLGLVDVVTFEADRAYLDLYSVSDLSDPIRFSSPTAPDESLIKNPIQKVGAIETYVRRYLYMLMLDIIETDVIEETTDKDEAPAPAKKNNRPASPEKREEVKKELIDESGEASEVQIKSIKNGLRKLRARDAEKYEPYIRGIAKKIKAGLKKSDAEEILLEISDTVKEA